MNSRYILALFPTILWSVCSGARADVVLSPLFSDHAVLQKAEKVPVWGKATAGEQVTVSFAGLKEGVQADENGNWRVNLNLADKGAGPFDLVVEGKNRIVSTDIIVGEVWLCSGQSNMAFQLRHDIHADTEIAASANPQFRQFLVDLKWSPTPVNQVSGRWMIAGPETAEKFTAVGYYFGKNLQHELGRPVGIILNSVGGTPVEAWTSSEALATDPDLKQGAENSIKHIEEYPTIAQAKAEEFGTWETKYGRQLPPPADTASFTASGIVTSDWIKVTLPGTLSAAGLPDAGAIWLRKTIHIPDTMLKGAQPLDLGKISDFETIYFNGNRVSETTPGSGSGGPEIPCHSYVESCADKDGQIVIAVRITAPNGGAAVLGDLSDLHFGSISLAGEWLAKTEKALPPPSDEARACYPKYLPVKPYEPPTATYLFNGMINPVIPYAIRGVVWYQGEGNAGRAVQYRKAFPLLIRDWRSRWGEGDFPFYFCQLPNYQKKRTNPGNGWWAELREAQTSALSLPNTAQAVLIELGEEANIHPRDKQPVGDRLSKIALARTYGKAISSSGPVYESIAIEGDTVRVKFSHTDGGLVVNSLPATYQPSSLSPITVPLVRNSPHSQVEGFAICGEDHKWKWADANIEGDTILVHAADVAKPVALRYAWADNPTCNLYNGAGWPACPFRTDDFVLTTAGYKY